MAEVFTVETRGIGKPDYSTAVSSGVERKGLKLSYKQTLEIFGIVFSAIPSPFAWVKAPLAIGATAHYIDNSTGHPLPFTVPKGYILSLIAGGYGLTEDAIAWVYFDGALALAGGVMHGGNSSYENRVVGITTATVDPTGSAPHTIDIQVTNLGAGPLQGGIDWTGILEEVGTPPSPNYQDGTV